MELQYITKANAINEASIVVLSYQNNIFVMVHTFFTRAINRRYDRALSCSNRTRASLACVPLFSQPPGYTNVRL